MAHSEALADRIRRALATTGAVREKTMFGGLSFMVNEKMVLSVRANGDLLVRADPARTDGLLTLEGARPAEMGAGRPMGRGWLLVGDEATATDEGLEFWVGVALGYNRTGARTHSRVRRYERSP